MKFAGQENFFGVGQRLAAVGFEGTFRRNHNSFGTKRYRRGAHPFASITWIRFNGSFAFAKLSACPPAWLPAHTQATPPRRQRQAGGDAVTVKGKFSTPPGRFADRRVALAWAGKRRRPGRTPG